MPTNRLKNRILLIAVMAGIILLVGTVGFSLLEGYPPFDAFYMTLITMTTVGYSEIHQLTPGGRVFNVFVMVFGVSVMFFAIGVMTEFIIEVQLGEFFGRRRMKRMIDTLTDHYILCGFGRVGRGAAQELKRSRVPFVVVDNDTGRAELASKLDMLVLVSDATSDESLRDAGINRAKGLIAALPTDAENLFLVLSSKTLNPSLRVAARVNEDQSEAKLKRAGADATFRPYNITGYRLAQAILRPFVFEFLDLTTSTVDFGQNIGIEQIKVAENCPLSAKSLKDLRLGRDLGVIVLAVRRAGGEMEFNPSADTVVDGGDYLVVMGDLAHMARLQEMASAKA